FGRAVGDLAPDVAGNGGRFFGRPVPHHGAEPGAGDAAGHGGPHAPRSDHADGADFVGHVDSPRSSVPTGQLTVAPVVASDCRHRLPSQGGYSPEGTTVR